MSIFPNGENRPRASAGTIINSVIMIIMLITMSAGAVAAVISMTNTIGDIRGDVKVLQGQMTDVRETVRDMSQAIKDAQRKDAR